MDRCSSCLGKPEEVNGQDERPNHGAVEAVFRRKFRRGLMVGADAASPLRFKESCVCLLVDVLIHTDDLEWRDNDANK